ncbi:MAG: tryptophan synthetase [Chaenotheca gracillima]|nr:MAG: tryptophan synthetase [Chaenotheca gracillima]
MTQQDSSLSITGSIVGIVALLLSLITIFQALYTFTISVRDAPDEILSLFNQVSKSSKSLTIARSYLLKSFTARGKDEVERQRYFHILEASRESLQPSGTLAWALFKELRSFYPAVNIMRCPVPEVVTDSYNLMALVRELKKVEQDKSMSLWKRVRWIYKRKDLHVLAGRLSEQQDALNALHLTTINEELAGQRRLIEEIGYNFRRSQNSNDSVLAAIVQLEARLLPEKPKPADTVPSESPKPPMWEYRPYVPSKT